MFKYKNSYKEIKEGTVSRFAKNTTLGAFKVTTYFAVVLAFVISILFFVEYNENSLDESKIAGIIFIFIGLILFAFAKIIKSNIKKRNQISKLSKLLEDMVVFVENSNSEERKRFEYLLDEEIGKNKLNQKPEQKEFEVKYE